MSKVLLAAIIFFAVTAPTAVADQIPSASDPTRRSLDAPPDPATLLPTDRASAALLTSIVTWLSTNFDLEPTALLPRIKYASAAAIAAHRNRAFLGAGGPSVSPSDDGRTTIAVYDRTEATIYLPRHWMGQTPAELSVLVHEMVHHLQNVANTKFECPQAREQQAYAAQQRWLGLFGRTLEEEFQIDPFTLLVTTRCMH